jgi:exonuclease III
MTANDPYNSMLPLASAVTFNQRGSSWSTRGPRHRKNLNNIITLANNYDIIGTQETRFQSKENSAYKTALPAHSVFYNNHSSAKAGVATLISPRLCTKYKIEEITFPDVFKGHLLVLHLKHRADSFPSDIPLRPLTIVNLHIKPKSESGSHDFRNQLFKTLKKKLRNLPGSHMFLGDFNFTEHPADPASGENMLKGSPRENWLNSNTPSTSSRSTKKATHASVSLAILTFFLPPDLIGSTSPTIL